MYKKLLVSSLFLITAFILFACSSAPEGVSSEAYKAGKDHVSQMEKCADSSSCNTDEVFEDIFSDLEGLEGENSDSKDSDIADQTFVALIFLSYLKDEDGADARSEYETEIDNLRTLLGEKPKYE
ncbi:hypothetical protein ACI2JA_01625 [Alkalihalobacillus sp. NPDC078783]